MVMAATLTMAAAPGAHAASCRAGRSVYADSGLRLVVSPGRRVRLTACTRAAHGARPVPLPTGVTRVVAAQRFGDLVGVLVARRAADGAGAAIVEVRRDGSPGPVALVGKDVLAGRAIRQFAVQAGSPYLALLLDTGDLTVLRSADDGSVVPWSAGQAFGKVAPRSLALDVPGAGVTWRNARGSVRSAPLLPSPGCHAPGRDVHGTLDVRVFETTQGGTRSLYACRLSTGRTTQLTYPTGSSGNFYPDPISAASIMVSGTFVLYEVSVAFDPDGGEVDLRVLDLERGGLRAVVTDVEAADSIGAVALAADGVPVYTERVNGGGGPCPKGANPGGAASTLTALIAAEPPKARTLECRPDPKPADPSADWTPSITDLKVDGQTLTWSSLGTPKSATIG